jgi:hypothetical protein
MNQTSATMLELYSFTYHQPVPAGNPVSRSVRGKHYGTSLRQHARIGISTVLSAHITVALHPLHLTTRSTSPALSELPRELELSLNTDPIISF